MLREKHRFKENENRVMRIFQLRWRSGWEAGKHCTMGSFIT
jgi:hypothetical protein